MKEPESSDPWHIPPWEEPGNCRADAAPHRGTLLRRLGNVSLFLAIASWYSCLSLCILPALYVMEKEPYGILLLAPALVLALLALLVAVTTVALAKSDLAEMRQGLIDPNGEPETEFARRRAAVGMVIGLASLVIWGVLAAAETFGL
jgi:hypothetical protein